jgi:hypothetical protein
LGDGNGIVGVMPVVQGFVRCDAGSLWIVIIPKCKDRFMERPLLNSLVVISWHTPWKCVRVLVGTTSIRLSEDNHDSWETCTTSAECKTVITTMLTVMSGMDPHMIS